MTTVGILGGGQLARMLALSGAPLGLRFLVMDTAGDACAGQCAPMVVGDYRDDAALAEFASRIDVATFDFENVPAESARWLAARVPVFPSPRALATAQDRLVEKTLFRELDIPVPEFAAIAVRADLDAAIARIGAPCILKTRRLGYDGKGQFRLKAPADAGIAHEVAQRGCPTEPARSIHCSCRKRSGPARQSAMRGGSRVGESSSWGRLLLQDWAGIFNIWPGRIRSGSVSWSRFASKIRFHSFALP